MGVSNRVAHRWDALPAVLNVRRALVAGIVAMLVVAVAPVLVGWHSTVVVSASMSPGIWPGDVVVAAPRAQNDSVRVAPGSVVLVDDPAAPGQLLLHRLTAYDDEGRMILKGDANPAVDSTPVPLQNVRGVASLRIPFIGLPYFWLREGSFLPAVAAIVLLLALVAWSPSPRGGALSIARGHRWSPSFGGRHRGCRPAGRQLSGPSFSSRPRRSRKA